MGNGECVRSRGEGRRGRVFCSQRARLRLLVLTPVALSLPPHSCRRAPGQARWRRARARVEREEGSKRRAGTALRRAALVWTRATARRGARDGWREREVVQCGLPSTSVSGLHGP